MSEINLLDDVAPASNELGAISDMAQQMYDLQEEIMKLELSLKQMRRSSKFPNFLLLNQVILLVLL